MANFNKLNEFQLAGLWSAIVNFSESSDEMNKVNAVMLIYSMTRFGVQESKDLVECPDHASFIQLYNETYKSNAFKVAIRYRVNVTKRPNKFAKIAVAN